MPEKAAFKTVKQELDQLMRAAGGTLAPGDIVAWAYEHEDSALHQQFNWDDTEAAVKWRLHQARNLMRIYVTVVKPDTTPVRAFVSLKQDRTPDRGYRTIVDVLANVERRAQLLDQALAEAESWQKRYQALDELAAIFAEIDAAKRNRRKRK